jgi:hypothetical protein
MSSSAADPVKNYLVSLQFYHHKEILEMAEGLYDTLIKVVVYNTIYTTSPNSYVDQCH